MGMSLDPVPVPIESRPRRRWRLWMLMTLIALCAVGALVVKDRYGLEILARWEDWRACRPFHSALSGPTSVNQPVGTPLDKVLMAIAARTTSPSLPSGVPIFVDPVGLQEARATMSSPITIRDSSSPLSVSLREALKSVKLDHHVSRGLLIITSPNEIPDTSWFGK